MQHKLEQGSQTQIYQRAKFQTNAKRTAVYYKKKLLRAAAYKKSPQNELNLIKIYNFVVFGMFTGCKMHLAGRMLPAGHMFETPELEL